MASGDIVPTDGRLFDAGTFDESALSGRRCPCIVLPASWSAAA